MRAGRVGPEPLGIGRLVERRHRDGCPLGHPRGEPVRRHEDVVVAFVQRRRGQVRMADLPQQVDLAAAGRRLLQAEEVDGDVLARGRRPSPSRAGSGPGRVAGPLERALEGPREVVVAPALGDVAARDADAQAVAGRRRPRRRSRHGPTRRSVAAGRTLRGLRTPALTNAPASGSAARTMS